MEKDQRLKLDFLTISNLLLLYLFGCSHIKLQVNGTSNSIRATYMANAIWFIFFYKIENSKA